MSWLARMLGGGQAAGRDEGRAGALYAQALAAQEARRGEEALELFRQAVEANPDNVDYRCALGAAYFHHGRAQEAAQACRAGLALDPGHVLTRSNLASALLALDDFEAALDELERVRALAPERAETLALLGYVQCQLGRNAEGLATLRAALQERPQDVDTLKSLLLAANYSADLRPEELHAEHRRFGDLCAQAVAAPAPDRAWPRRLRIGYVSPDFRSHVVASFMWPILARHNRDRFEVHCYYSNTIVDAATQGLRALADRWTDCAQLSDEALAERIRADRIDLLVDLAGHTSKSRLRMFALKPAPVQLTYLGYPNTSGLPAIDHRITDARADPPGESDRLHVERLLRLPRSFLCYRPGPDVGDGGPLPAQAAGFVTFGCFNNFQKLSPPFLDAAARILLRVPGSRLVLKARPLGLPRTAQEVRRRFTDAGIDPGRVDLHGWEPSPESHLAAYAHVDIALDSFPYNGTTTSCEAMWMGVPVVTVRGDRHAGRVGASLLHSVGLDELVGEDLDGYVETAARLAADLPRLAALRRSLRERMRASALMDEVGFVRELEAALLEAWSARQERAARPAGGEPVPAVLARARALREAGRTAEAIAACAGLLQHDPAQMDVLALHWDLCHEAAEHAAAIDALGGAIAAQPGAARLHYMLGCTLQDAGRAEDAMAAYRRALALEPGLAKAHNNLGCLLEFSGRRDEAEGCYEQAVRADPELASAVHNRASARLWRGDAAGAEADLRRALAMEPQHADWHCQLGEALALQGKPEAAAASFDAALEIDPQDARVHFGRGNVLGMMGMMEESEDAFRRALALQPGFAEAHGNLLLCMHYRKGDDAPAMFAEHLEWARRHASGLPRRPHRMRPRRGALRVGYVSPNFCEHAVAWAIEPVFAAHDRERFKVHFYSTVERHDSTTARFMKLCDEWRDIRALSADAAARLVADDRIDILVDLAGHTGGGRPLLFARKPAPLQVNWQGYPNTTGLAEMDFRITDADADPEGTSERFHTEELVRLPSGFFCYAPPPRTPEVGRLPALQAGRITFGCFNNLAKVTPGMIELWSRLLRRLPEARMLMKAHALGAERARRNIHGLFERHGIPPARVTLLGPEDSHGGHLARYGEMDIALDSFPYHGTATTCEALWMGVPVVTLAGRTHLSRVGVSILGRVGLPELVARDPQEYVDKALALAADLPRLGEMRAGLRARLLASPLLDAAAFARALEAAYREMWDRRCAS